MSETRNFPNQHVKNVLDGNNLSISAPCPSAQGKWSSLNFRVTKGNPRIIIYTNDPNDSGNDHGRIVVKMHPLSFGALLETWAKAISQESGWKETIEIEDYTWGRGGQRSDKPELTHKIIIGKDGDGVISLMVLDAKIRDRPRIKFEVKAPRFIKVIGADGAQMDKAAESIRFSEIWLKILSSLTSSLYVSTYEEPKKRPQQGGGYGGGQGGSGGNYNNNNNNQGRRQGGDAPVADDFDSDIPF